MAQQPTKLSSHSGRVTTSGLAFVSQRNAARLTQAQPGLCTFSGFLIYSVLLTNY
jgi:hypothetical protein